MYSNRKKFKIVIANIKNLHYSSSYDVVVMPQGLGDILFFCMYAQEYKRIHNCNRLALVVTKKHFKDLAKIYKACFEKIIYIDEQIFSSVNMNKFTFLYSKIYDDNSPKERLVDAIKDAMNVPQTANAYYPMIYIRKSEKRRIDKIGVPFGKGILIAPDAVSCSIDMTQQDWINIADMLSSMGYTVFFNSKNPNLYGKYKKIFLSVRETIIFTHYAGAFIGFRSGLCDVIAAFSDCNQFIIYPNNRMKGEFKSITNYDSNPNEKYMHYCSLQYTFPDRNIFEYIYKKENLMQKIKEVFKNGKNFG